MKQNFFLHPLLWLGLSLTLGLAPFLPEPHVWEKLKWVYSGASGMKLIDWIDLVMHGFPWIMLMLTSVRRLRSK